MTGPELALANSILKKVVRLTGVPADVLLARGDGTRTENARRIAYLMMREEFSLTEVGAFFNRSGATVFTVTKNASEAERLTAARWLTEVRYMRRRRMIEKQFEQLDIDFVDLVA